MDGRWREFLLGKRGDVEATTVEKKKETEVDEADRQYEAAGRIMFDEGRLRTLDVKRWAREGLAWEGVSTLLVGDSEFDSPKTLAAFALGLVLFLVTLGLNVIALGIVRRYRQAYD